MPATTYLANKLLEHQVGKASYTMPTVYVGLSSTAPTLAGANVTEPIDGSYARVVTSATTWNSASAGSITNAQAITFAQATGDWLSGANLTHGVLYDAPTGGNLLGYGTLSTAKNILNGDTASIAIGQLTITIS